MQRIGAQEIGSSLRCDDAQNRQIGEVADPPVALRAQLVKLNRDAPCTTVPEPFREEAFLAFGRFEHGRLDLFCRAPAFGNHSSRFRLDA
jgi:hypothetical protein